uniref:Ganglioside GM2 activator n=2 Tax=Callorhinchus milii TaxID=7868 RepID=K4FYQ1_CALMI|nr:ganglioside GM2 activator-like precursor [Callorhinchus milii]AFK11557.1 Ganglioside GM2 activator precursor [Callorhinchus milii]|eukprot:gi/632964405/ref/XP_007898383.1/ PREDICTED: ganglioside GM2 activator-like [Callorhinchus milii]
MKLLLLSVGCVFASLADANERDSSRRHSVRRLEAFSWANCRNAEPVVIKSLSIKPDPVSIPGFLRASVFASVGVSLQAPLTIHLTLEKEVAGIWVTIPCIEELGSCTYENICQQLDALIPPGQNCPEPLFTYGIPCHCPFKKGDYNLPDSSFYIPSLDLPSWLTSGNYKATAILSGEKGSLACVKISISLRAD